MKLRLVPLALVSACATPSSSTHPVPPTRSAESAECPTERPRGEPADYAAPTDLPDITVAEPAACNRGQAYIRVERIAGARRLGTARIDDGGFREGCMALPADPAEPTDCPVINVNAVLQEAYRELAAQHIDVNGLGMGPCGSSQGDYAAWDLSIGVGKWADAEAAVRAVAGVLARYDLAGYTGVAVRGTPCGVPLLEGEATQSSSTGTNPSRRASASDTWFASSAPHTGSRPSPRSYRIIADAVIVPSPSWRAGASVSTEISK
jgi:hypothetical protein